jgi:methylmalonyl-CoA mutase C-terminal domain/subunit
MRTAIKVLLTKIGLDGHDRGFRLVATALRDAGMEVLPTGPWLSTEEVVSIAVQEDVEVIGISSLSFDHLLVPGLMDQLRQARKSDAMVIVGGIIPDEDVPSLKASGVEGIFHPGTNLSEVVEFIESRVHARRVQQQASFAHA